MSLEQNIADGYRAKEILEDPIYINSYEAVKAEIIQLWLESKTPAEREYLHQMLQALDKVQAAMNQLLETGKLSREQLQYQQSLVDKAKALVGLR